MDQYRQNLKKKHVLIFALFSVILFAVFVWNVVTGSVKIPVSEIPDILRGEASGDTFRFILMKIRIPRALASLMGGGFLAVSGLLLQVFFRNPIAGPFVLGISSGATVMVSLVMLTGIALGLGTITPFLTTIAAFTGAYGAMLIVLSVASRVKSPVTLLIVGLMIGYLCHAVTSILVAFAEKSMIKGFVLWQLGSFSGFRWAEIQVMALFGGAILVVSFLLSKPLNAYLLGEEYAASMGVNIRVFRLLILMCSCALAGMVTSFAGPVAFVGLAVPHMARLLFKTSDNRILIPGSVLMGAMVAGLCDLVARMLFSPVELPLSAITSFFGAPVVISLLIKRRIRS